MRLAIVSFCYYYAMVLGVTSVRFDMENHEIYTSRILSIYATCINAAVVSVMPYIYSRCWQSLEHVNTDSTLLRLTDLYCIGIHFIVIILTIAYRRARENSFEGVARALFAMDEYFFDKFKLEPAVEQSYNRIFVAKFFTMGARLGTTIFAVLQMLQVVNWKTILVALYFCNVQNYIHAVVFHYFGTLWHACRRFEKLNTQLQLLLQELQHQAMQCQSNYSTLYGKSSEGGVRKQLQIISKLHWHLTGLISHLSESYKHQIMSVLLTYLIHNVAYGYYAVLMSDGTMPLAFNRIEIAYCAFTYSVMLGDLYLFYWICHTSEYSYHSTQTILKDYRNLPLRDELFERNCEAFSLQLVQRKLTISMGGMFSINKQTLICLWAYILRHTLILVQFDYEYRYRRTS